MAARTGKKEPEKASRSVGKVETKKEAVSTTPPQSNLYEKAMEHFNARNFREAMELFKAALPGPSLEIGHASRLHLKMCEQRLGQLERVPKSADDQYNLAVAMINSRDLPQARVLLEAALETLPHGGHVHYAMALLSGLEGNYAASARSLARAIEIDPGNRAAAHNDPDFHEILRHPELRAMVEPQGVPTA